MIVIRLMFDYVYTVNGDRETFLYVLKSIDEGERARIRFPLTKCDYTRRVRFFNDYVDLVYTF